VIDECSLAIQRIRKGMDSISYTNTIQNLKPGLHVPFIIGICMKNEGSQKDALTPTCPLEKADYDFSRAESKDLIKINHCYWRESGKSSIVTIYVKSYTAFPLMRKLIFLAQVNLNDRLGSLNEFYFVIRLYLKSHFTDRQESPVSIGNQDPEFQFGWHAGKVNGGNLDGMPQIDGGFTVILAQGKSA